MHGIADIDFIDPLNCPKSCAGKENRVRRGRILSGIQDRFARNPGKLLADFGTTTAR
jgi:hypothetical protein